MFKVVAYHRAADAIAACPVDVARAFLDGKPPKLPGVGPAIADKIIWGKLPVKSRLIPHLSLVLCNAGTASSTSGTEARFGACSRIRIAQQRARHDAADADGRAARRRVARGRPRRCARAA